METITASSICVILRMILNFNNKECFIDDLSKKLDDYIAQKNPLLVNLVMEIAKYADKPDYERYKNNDSDIIDIRLNRFKKNPGKNELIIYSKPGEIKVCYIDDNYNYNSNPLFYLYSDEAIVLQNILDSEAIKI